MSLVDTVGESFCGARAGLPSMAAITAWRRNLRKICINVVDFSLLFPVTHIISHLYLNYLIMISIISRLSQLSHDYLNYLTIISQLSHNYLNYIPIISHPCSPAEHLNFRQRYAIRDAEPLTRVLDVGKDRPPPPPPSPQRPGAAIDFVSSRAIPLSHH